jgi:hypothetical protein
MRHGHRDDLDLLLCPEGPRCAHGDCAKEPNESFYHRRGLAAVRTDIWDRRMAHPCSHGLVGLLRSSDRPGIQRFWVQLADDQLLVHCRVLIVSARGYGQGKRMSSSPPCYVCLEILHWAYEVFTDTLGICVWGLQTAALTVNKQRLDEFSMVFYNNLLSLPFILVLVWVYGEVRLAHSLLECTRTKEHVQ